MCKKTKFWLLLASCLILCGALLFGGVMFFLKWNFLKLGTVEMQTKTYEVSEAFSSISVDVKNADVAFLPSDTDVCRVVCYENVKCTHAVEVVEGTLRVSATDQRKWYDHIKFGSVTPLIQVYLPIGQYEALQVRGRTGDVGIPKDFSFASIDVQVTTGDVNCFASAVGEMKLKATTGDLFVENVSAGSLSCSVTTGDVTLNGVQCTGDMSVSAGTGDINFNGVSCNDLTTSVSTGDTRMTDVSCNNLSISGKTGDVLLKNVLAAQKLTVQQSSGDVSFDACDAAEIFIKLTTGDVTGTLRSDKTFIVSSTTGHVQYPNTVGGTCEIKVTTGDVALDILR